MSIEDGKASVLKSDPSKPPVDTIGRKKNACPWCNHANKDEMKPEGLKEKCDSVLVQAYGKWQCLTCGKNWEVQAIGKPWTIELERGIAWARENQARALREA